MIVWYVLVACLIFIKLAMGDLDTARKRKLYLFFAGLCTVLVMGLRGYEGEYTNDVTVYQRLYERIAETDWTDIFTVNHRLEHGYIIFNKLLTCITPDAQLLVIVEALVSVGCVCLFIYDNTDYVFESFFFYVTLGSMTFALTAFRQSFAISICLLAAGAIRRRRSVLFALTVLLAATFHRTALIFLVSYPLCRLPLLRRHRLLLIPCIGLVVAAIPLIIQVGVQVMGSEDATFAQDAAFSFNGIVPILIYLISVGADLMDRRPVVEDARRPLHEKTEISSGESGSAQTGSGSLRADLSECTILTATGLGLYFMRFYETVLERAAFYFTPASVVGLARLTARLRRMDYGLVAEMFILLLCILLYVHRISGMAVAEYHFFWTLR